MALQKSLIVFPCSAFLCLILYVFGGINRVFRGRYETDGKPLERTERQLPRHLPMSSGVDRPRRFPNSQPALDDLDRASSWSRPSRGSRGTRGAYRGNQRPNWRERDVDSARPYASKDRYGEQREFVPVTKRLRDLEEKDPNEVL